MNLPVHFGEHSIVSRRQILQSAALGFGHLAFQTLCMSEASARDANLLSPKAPHFPTRAKRMVFLFMK